MSTHPRPRRTAVATLALSLLLPIAAGCDSAADLTLDAAFFVGNWQLESVRDGAGDRTAEVHEIVDDLRVTFTGDDTFLLLIVYAEASEQPDQTFSGTYAVSAGQLVLTPDDLPVAIAFGASAVGENQVELRAPAAIIHGLIEGAIDIGLTGTVVLTMNRGGPGA